MRNNELNYMRTHTLAFNKFWRVYWNLFRRPHKDFGLCFFSLNNEWDFQIKFGKGEFVISIYKDTFKK